jgi:hypothetical protein
MENKQNNIHNRRRFLKRTAAWATLAAMGPSFISRSLASPAAVRESARLEFLQQPDKNGVFIISRGGHTPEEIAAANAEIPPVHYLPPSDRWQHLTKTVSALGRSGGELRVVMLGDSIVNDTHRSDWTDLLQAQYPNCKVSIVAVVRGSTGCWWYKDDGRVKHYVTPLKPDLLIIGGISHKNDTDSIRVVIDQARAEQPCDVLLMTGAFGETDPNDDQQWTFDIPITPENYRRKLLNLAAEMHTGFLDMTAHWGRYIRASNHELVWFKRDQIHANIRGEQVLGHIMAGHFAPPLPRA